MLLDLLCQNLSTMNLFWQNYAKKSQWSGFLRHVVECGKPIIQRGIIFNGNNRGNIIAINRPRPNLRNLYSKNNYPNRQVSKLDEFPYLQNYYIAQCLWTFIRTKYRQILPIWRDATESEFARTRNIQRCWTITTFCDAASSPTAVCQSCRRESFFRAELVRTPDL